MEKGATASPIVLKFLDHHNRLGNIALFVRFLDGAIVRTASSLPGEAKFIEAQENLLAGMRRLGEAIEPPHKFDVEEIKIALGKAAIPSEGSRSLIYSLCLVMLVTQVEIFIEHLIDAILSADPRRLKELAGDKQLNSRDLVDAQNYEAVLARLRDKVAKEATGSSTREMFEKHLGQRFKLFRREALTCATMNEAGKTETWGISEIEAIWNTRHEIVHEGRMNLTQIDFERALFACAWIETFLSFRAQEVYGLVIDSPSVLKTFLTLYHNVQPFVLNSLQVGWVLSGFLNKLVEGDRAKYPRQNPNPASPTTIP